MLADYRWMTEHRITPEAGGRLDQDARFVRAVDVIDEELGVLRRAKLVK